jgi:mxaJ protein
MQAPRTPTSFALTRLWRGRLLPCGKPLALVGLLLLASVLVTRARAAGGRALRVCADPNALPFSNERGQGFENRLAELLARDLGVKLEYTWWAERRGFFRNTLKAKRCDVVMGVPVGIEMAATTEPYYAASYAFVSRAELGAPLDSFDDPRLRTLRVGVALVGDDGVNSPPVHALARRGIVANVLGYSVFGDYSDPAPLAAPVRAVESGAVDVAIVWAPVAAWFARRSSRPLVVRELSAASDAGIPERFAIALGVRRGDTELRERLNVFLKGHRPAIVRLLAGYGLDAERAP